MVFISLDQSKLGPYRFICLVKFLMLFLVTILGCVFVLIAKFSVGKPKASQPIGYKTLKPVILFFRATISIAI